MPRRHIRPVSCETRSDKGRHDRFRPGNTFKHDTVRYKGTINTRAQWVYSENANDIPVRQNCCTMVWVVPV